MAAFRSRQHFTNGQSRLHCGAICQITSTEYSLSSSSLSPFLYLLLCGRVHVNAFYSVIISLASSYLPAPSALTRWRERKSKLFRPCSPLKLTQNEASSAFAGSLETCPGSRECHCHLYFHLPDNESQGIHSSISSLVYKIR